MGVLVVVLTKAAGGELEFAVFYHGCAHPGLSLCSLCTWTHVGGSAASSCQPGGSKSRTLLPSL